MWAVVCNAGICEVGELEWQSLESVQKVLDINVMGTIRTVKTFLPMLRKTKGRIVLTASVLSKRNRDLCDDIAMSYLSFQDIIGKLWLRQYLEPWIRGILDEQGSSGVPRRRLEERTPSMGYRRVHCATSLVRVRSKKRTMRERFPLRKILAFATKSEAASTV